MSSQPSDDTLSTKTAKAQLRKLELEVECLIANQSKLPLELEELRTKQSFGNKLAPYASVIAALIAVAGFLWGVYQFHHQEVERENAANVQKLRENDIRERELTQHIDSQYRTELTQLLQFPTDEKLTIPFVTFLLTDLTNLIENDLPEKDKAQRSKQLGEMLYNMMMQTDFDFSKDRTVEFDVAAMRYCPSYRAFLASEPDSQANLMSNKYWAALDSVHTRDAKLIKSIGIEGTFFRVDIPLGKEKLFEHFQNLHAGYKAHVVILKKGPTQAGESSRPEQRDRALYRTFCWLYAATENEDISREVFGLSLEAIRTQWRTCAENPKRTESSLK